MQPINLSDCEKIILQSYCDMLDGLADYFGESYEIVLHSLENFESSAIKVINGFHTGRAVGSPITDLALSMLQKIESGNHGCYTTYRTQNKNGRPLRSATIAIYGEQKRIIGLLCINFYMDTPFLDIINHMSDVTTSIAADSEKSNSALEFKPEYFAENSEDMLMQSIRDATRVVSMNHSIPASLQNKEIITNLAAQGVFQFKGAVQTVASELGISQNTVYLHLRNAKTV